MKKLAAVLVTVIATLAPLSQAASAATTTARTSNAPSCRVHWGTRAKHANRMVSSKVLRVRAGQHRCFDRLVVELGQGREPGFAVQYVAKIIADGSGKVLHVRGGARLLITIQAPAGRRYHPLARNLADVSGFRAFRQVRGAGSFEGVTSIGLGVRTRLPFRVFEVRGPRSHSRLVIDVADLK